MKLKFNNSKGQKINFAAYSKLNIQQLNKIKGGENEVPPSEDQDKNI